MSQRRVPSAPDYPGDYVISGYREIANRWVSVEVVADNLQRIHVCISRDRSDADQIDQTIRHTLAGLYRRPDPVR